MVVVEGRGHFPGVFLRQYAAGRTPVAIFYIGDYAVLLFGLQELDPLLHTVIVFLNDLKIAVIPVHGPGYGDIRSTPGGICRVQGPVRRDHVRKAAVLKLRILDILEVLHIEGGHIEIVNGLFHHQLCITHPAHALIPLGAVGGHAHQVSQLPIDNVLVDFVEERLGAGEAACVVHSGVEEACF